MELQPKLRKIGNSLGFLVPKKIVKQLNLSPGDEIVVEIAPKRPIVIFGLLKGIDLNPNEAKIFREEEEW